MIAEIQNVSKDSRHQQWLITACSFTFPYKMLSWRLQSKMKNDETFRDHSLIMIHSEGWNVDQDHWKRTGVIKIYYW